MIGNITVDPFFLRPDSLVRLYCMIVHVIDALIRAYWTYKPKPELTECGLLLGTLQLALRVGRLHTQANVRFTGLQQNRDDSGMIFCTREMFTFRTSTNDGITYSF